MRRHAKASSAGPTDGSGAGRGLFRRAFATRGASNDAKGIGAPSLRLGLAPLFALAALLALAVSLASAAAALAAQTHVFTGSFDSAGSGDGQLELAAHSGLAVNEATDVYVADIGPLA